jgi:group II intron reverse transcriptase/maturase
MESLKGNTAGAQEPDPVSTKRQRIAELGQRNPRTAFTSLAHHIDLDWLKCAYRLTRKTGAPGVDARTASDYEANLEENLRSLLDRAKSGCYKAPPVKRVHIPKGKGNETRPIGIPTFEDKVLQRAVVMLLEMIYEQDFMNCSYGFRPGRSAHQALEAIWQQQKNLRTRWIVEADIRGFFDTLDHSRLRELVKLRVRDGVLLRLISKWLHAGVMEGDRLTYPEAGTPQGGVISPLLANIYLHYALDVWIEQMIKPWAKGRVCLVRYADDFVIGFSNHQEARKVLEALPKRFAKYGLTLHPKKTRLVDFRRPSRPSPPPGGRPETFDFLGFTHYWARSRRGYWVVTRKTATDRFSRATHSLSQWCRRNRHQKVRWQHCQLVQKLQGHYGYYGITGNGPALERFWEAAKRIWRAWLSRRSDRPMNWARFVRLMQQYPLPKPVVVHSTWCVAKP